MEKPKDILEKIEKPRNKDELVPAWWIQNNILTFVDQALAKLKEEPEHSWIPVSERLPKEGTYLVLYNDGEQKLLYEACFSDKKWYSMTGHGISFITHWMPIILPGQLRCHEKDRTISQLRQQKTSIISQLEQQIDQLQAENKQLVEGQVAKKEAGS